MLHSKRLMVHNYVAKSIGHKEGGVRARKRLETAERLALSALRLFLQNGYEATTLRDITSAAQVSLRTFFHYFPSKEDLLDCWQAAYRDAVVADIATWPDNVCLTIQVIEALCRHFGARGDEVNGSVTQLFEENPVLRARDFLRTEEFEVRIRDAILDRYGTRVTPLEASLAATLSISALRAMGRTHADFCPKDDRAVYLLRAVVTLEVGAFKSVGEVPDPALRSD